jgi:Spy/CpxP family protein refolding chaperone
VASLIVEGVRTKTTIYNTVLTPAQQQQVQTMMAGIGPRMEQHIDNLPAMADRFVGMAAWRLNLSDAQQEQIRSLIDAGVQKDLPLVKQLAQERQDLVTATAGGKFDEAQVRQLAQAPATTATELAGDAAVLKSQVFAVLTPAQRDQVIAFQQQRHARRAGWFGHGLGGFMGA